MAKLWMSIVQCHTSVRKVTPLVQAEIEDSMQFLRYEIEN